MCLQPNASACVVYGFCCVWATLELYQVKWWSDGKSTVMAGPHLCIPGGLGNGRSSPVYTWWSG